MEKVLEIVEEEETHLVNTMEIVEEIVEEEETHLVNTMEIVEEIVEEEETQLVNTVETGSVVEMVDEEETQLVKILDSRLKTLPEHTEACIYRVPNQLRRVNEEAYTPMQVSIGPFHHGKESLQDMEVQKQRYLKDFLKRRPDLDLGYLVRTLNMFEKSARKCYAENIHFSRKEFVQMMLLDGCFIVEFLIKLCHAGQRNKDDPIFNSDVIWHGIVRDMVLLENQLPFFILQHLFDLIVTPFVRWGNSFLEIAINTMDSFMSTSESEVWIPFGATIYQAKHMVDLCLQYYTTKTGGDIFRIPNASKLVKLSPNTGGDICRIPNASRLHESGVKFTKCTRSGVKYLLDVIFTNGNLEIPSVKFESQTETFLRNMVAYEPSYSKGNTQIFTEYIFLMDCLIDTPNDVELLTKAGIINNLLGDNGEVAQIFNKLRSGVRYESDFWHQLFEDVNDYSNIRWHGWVAKLQRNCFDTPWRSLSVATAVILLILTFIQTVCSILQLKG